jgi:hypothetical protein
MRNARALLISLLALLLVALCAGPVSVGGN